MARVGLFFLARDAAALVSVLGRLQVCHIQSVPAELKEYLTPCFPEPFRESFRRLRDEYAPLAQRWQLAGEAALDAMEPHVPSAEEMDYLCESLRRLRDETAAIDQRVHALRQRHSELHQLDYHVRALADLGVDAQALADLRYLHLRAGTVPIENVERLRESAALAEDIVLHLGNRDDRAHVVVIGVGGMTADLEGLLAKAHFAPVEMPPQLLAAGTAQLLPDVERQAAELEAESDALRQADIRLRDRARPMLRAAAECLARAAVFAECEGAIEGHDPVAFLSGWVPQERLAELELALRRDLPDPVVLVHEPPEPPTHTADEPPSEISVPALLRPGANLVSLFGPPGYREINPTLVLVATTPLLFGMMFGDVGHGLLLGVVALALRRWLGRWLAPALSCSAGAVLFGFLYGSVFGREWLPALWLRPMTEPFRLLAAALWMGVAFLLLTFLLRAGVLLLEGRWAAAVCSIQGLAGAVLYAGAVLLLRAVYLRDSIPRAALWLGGLGLTLTLAHAGHEVWARGRAVLADLATEYFHGAISLLTNTLSFLRLAAFALSHAALSMALFLLVDVLPAGPVGSAMRGLALLLGSAIILVLDVLVVAVQTIRLEFYEGLTRYYRGDGRDYRPLRFCPTRENPAS
jgi:V/A-type H+-transporting ATPase subunit I